MMRRCPRRDAVTDCCEHENAELRATVEGLGDQTRRQEVLIERAHEMVTVELVLAKHGHREGPTGTPKYAAFLAALRDVLEGGDPPKPEPVEWP